jgi:hypothetical protein
VSAVRPPSFRKSRRVSSSMSSPSPRSKCFPVCQAAWAS